jgi:acetate kinase
MRPAFAGAVEGIGKDGGRLWMRSSEGREIHDRAHEISEQTDAVAAVADNLRELALPPLVAIGHRVVHGGPSLREHQRITPEVLAQLAAASHFAPLHVPVALRNVRALIPHFTKRCRRRPRDSLCRSASGERAYGVTDSRIIV